jgi:hypothetical protein
VRPAASAGPGTPPAIDPQKPADPEGRKGGGADATPPDIDPIIRGLVVRLPKSGDIWAGPGKGTRGLSKKSA